MSYLEHYLKRFSKWFEDPAMVELAINPDRRIWILRRGDVSMKDTGETVDPGLSKALTDQIAGASHAQTGREKLLVSATVTFKDRPIRTQSVVAPATAGEAALSFRLFASLPIDEIELKYLHGKQVSLRHERQERNKKLLALAAAGDLMDALRFCVEHRLNIVISGGTDTGKSVALRKLISMIPDDERIVTIEDARELFPAQPNAVALLADRAGTTRTTDMLLEATLRMRPDRLIVGEVRGKEAMTFLEAVNTGHGGSMTTIHAETPELALDRLAIAAGRSDVPMSYGDLRNYVLRTIDVIIQTGRVGDTRGIAEIFIPEKAA
ncbi:ATPase, T2SS/T4P/T4SS family [Ensifer sp. SL37]|uniref:ATPase, T2SS/T4P/T4SS family n=1 Tax=Ensifer sp. SL37 TaxID=2995137 RepID=UPI002276C5E1|nr:ATPase, T2SS/T4P/T4SS family [Ensifer sp. SL37]MCY1741009.1 ATPase, T2SS/T4P/T4SS family [Ensifer sp. SL37]